MFSLYDIVLFVIILAFSVAASMQDIREKKVSNILLWSAISAAFCCNIVFKKWQFWYCLLAAAVTGLFYFIIRLISRKKLGTADIFFGIFQGMSLPFLYIPLCVLLEVAAAFIFYVKRRNKVFPFIPFMSFALISAFVVSRLLSF